MRPIKTTILAAAVVLTAAGLFSGVASADPPAPIPPAPGPAPGPGQPPADPAAPATAAAAPGVTMDHDGIFIVGTDIQPGTYASAGPVADGTCYWKRMADLHGGDIIDNALTKKPQAVLIDPTDKAFKTSGCQPWQKTDAVAADVPQTGDIPALIAKAKLLALLASMNANARQYDGSQIPLG